MPHQTALEDLKSEATLAFAGDLGSLLARSADRKKVSYRFTRNPSVKDAIEACGVPHTEVNVILVNKQPVTFRYLLQAGDRVTVLPPRYPTEVPQNQWLAEQQLEQPRFILDVHLGKLARKLRLLGFDCLYRNNYDDREIAALAMTDRRTILTRDRGLLKYARIRSGLLIREAETLRQAAQVLNRYLLWDLIDPLARCITCNGLLERVVKETISDLLEPMTRKMCQDFWRCRDCGKIYWQGAHSRQIALWLEQLRRLEQKEAGREE